MSIKTVVKTVTTSPTLLITGPDTGVGGLPVEGEVYNSSAGTIYIGGSDVATSGAHIGRPVTTGLSYSFSLRNNDDLYAVAGSSLDVLVIAGQQ